MIILLMGFLPSAYGEETRKCALDKYQSYSKAKEKWQRESTEIIKKAKPGLREVAELYMKDQLLLIQKKRLAVEQMLALRPDRINTSFPPSRWLQLSDEEEDFLKQSSERYAELFKQAKAIKKRPPHPDGDALREAMRTEVINLPEFKESFSGFMGSVSEIEDRVCK